MDTTTYAQGNYLTPQVIRDSPQAEHKIGVIVSDAVVEDGKFGKQLSVNISFDKYIKTWRMNRESVKNMHELGTDSMNWIAKKVYFVVEDRKGKEVIIGRPVKDQ